MKKLLAILMTALMLLGLMAGCAPKQEAVEAPVEEVVEEAIHMFREKFWRGEFND